MSTGYTKRLDNFTSVLNNAAEYRHPYSQLAKALLQSATVHSMTASQQRLTGVNQ